MATYSRVKTFISNETLTASDLNAEFDNIITNTNGGSLDSDNVDTTATWSWTGYHTYSTSSRLALIDDIYLTFGNNATDGDYRVRYSNTNTAFEISTTNSDGAGADAVVIDIQDGTDDVRVRGGFSTDNNAAPTTGIKVGGNIVSDTDSTDNLGTTSVRWANLYVDSIGDTGQALTLTAGANNINATAGTLALTGAQTISSTLGVTGLITATAGVTSGSNIVSDTDSTDDLGTNLVRWANLYVDDITTTNAVTATTLNGTLGATSVLANGVTATTQSASDNSTKVATTAYVDGAVGTHSAGGSNTQVQYNSSGSFAGSANLTFDGTVLTAVGGITVGANIVSDTDSTDDLGTTLVRWANLFVDDVTVTTAVTATTLNGTLGATSVLANGVTATTQTASDNSTKVATTAYADAAATAAAGTPGGSNTHVQFNNAGAFGGSANLTFDGTNLTATLSATSVLASGVTATTQSASDNSTKVATTAYVETAVASGGAGAAFNEFLLIGA